MIKIAQGAEAVLYQDGALVIKERISKGYRLAYLDESLRRFRTKREAKVLSKLEELNFPAPHLKEFSEARLTMDFIPGEKLRDVLLQGKEHNSAYQIGDLVGKLHSRHIIHGDLTTSNMILKRGEVYFIDFGLGFESSSIEDKAVDLHLIRQALEARHFKHFDKYFQAVLEGYKLSKNWNETMKRLEKVEKRGRYKQAY